MLRYFCTFSTCLLFLFAKVQAQSPGNALDFNGTSSWVNCTLPAVFDSLSTQDITVEAWINSRSNTFKRVVYAQKAGDNFFNFAFASNGSIWFYVNINGTTYSATTTSANMIPLNQWTHVACRWTASTNSTDIFINGMQVATGAGGSSSNGTNGVLAIGARPGGAQIFDGQIDEVRIWREARAQCDIVANMNAEFTGPATNLVAYYKFNQGVAGGNNAAVTSLPDQSGFGNNGSLSGFALTGTGSNWVASMAAINVVGPFAGGYMTNDTVAVCPGTVYTFPDGSTQTITSPVTQTSVVTATDLCDSTVVTTVNLNPTYSVNDTDAVCSGGSYTFPDGSTQNNITSPTTYTSFLSSSLGCDSVIVTSLSILQGSSMNDTVEVCSGASYTFPDSTTQNNITNPTTYTSVLSDAQGCDSIIVTLVGITQVDATVTISGVGNAASANQANATYQWLDCNNGLAPVSGATSMTFSPAATGSYAVAVTFNGCTDTSGCWNIILVGMEEVPAFGLRAYPNPGRDKIWVETGIEVNGELSITDLRGKILYQASYEGQKTALQIGDLAKGIYLLQLNTTQGSQTIRLVKD